jgi:hypothetical protein
MAKVGDPVYLEAGTGSDTLKLLISQEAWRGSAQYTVSVDGIKIGGTFTSSSTFGSGHSDVLTIHGNWTPGQHNVAVNFVNDAYGGSAWTDRNLHVDGITYNGGVVSSTSTALMGNGAKSFSFSEVAPAPSGAVTQSGGSSGHHQFFSDASPWNTHVPGSASMSEVQGLDSLMSSHAVALTSWSKDYPSVAIYHATASDPLVQVRWMADTWSPVNSNGLHRSGNGASVDAGLLAKSSATSQYPMNPYSTQDADRHWNDGGAPSTSEYNEWTQSGGQVLQVRIPANAVPSPDGDGYTVIIQPDGRALEMYSPIKLGNGTWISEAFSFTDSVGGLGTGEENGRRAAMIPSYAGAITESDIKAGVIDHALAINVPASMLTAAYTGPALAFDSNPNYTGTLPMGSQLAVPDSINLGSLGLQTDLGKMIATAAQEYGVYVVDRGGSGITVATEYAPGNNTLSQYSWPVQQDLETVFHAAQLVHPDHVFWG